ncbi:MAG: hypothetical protein ACI9DC_001714 [Gammaproteobacteria bacterium]|jgi:hypothetical protein
MNSPDSERNNDEVERRVRRAVGFKFMRDLHELANAQPREDRQRPSLLLKLLVTVVVAALLALALSRML